MSEWDERVLGKIKQPGLELVNFTNKFLTRIVGITESGDDEHRGSGVFIDLNGQQAVFTAAHVFREAAKTGRYRAVAFSRSQGLPVGSVRGVIKYSDAYDLAVYLPEVHFEVGNEKGYFPVSNSYVDEKPMFDYVAVTGYPSRFSRKTSLGGLASFSESYHHVSAPRFSLSSLPESVHDALRAALPAETFLPDGLLGDHQFAISYAADTGPFTDSEGRIEDRQSAIDDWNGLYEDRESYPSERPYGAFGLSGSPVWAFGTQNLSFNSWTTKHCRFAGVVTHWNADYKILIATSARKFLEIASLL